MHDERDEESEEPDEPPRPLWWRAGAYLLQWAVALAVVAVLWQVIGAWRAPDLPGQAPDFRLRALSGEEVALADLRGRVVVLNFWATWCGPCRIEIPSFSKFAAENPDVTVLGVAVDGEPGELRRAAADLGITYPVVRADEATQRAYGVSTLPTTVIIDPEGRVRSAHTGILFGPQLAWLAR